MYLHPAAMPSWQRFLENMYFCKKECTMYMKYKIQLGYTFLRLKICVVWGAIFNPYTKLFKLSSTQINQIIDIPDII